MIIHTTVKGGLPVEAEGDVIVEGPTLWDPGDAWVEEIEVRFRSGHAYRDQLSQDDFERIERELISAAKDERDEYKAGIA